jgi:hypothetical protein
MTASIHAFAQTTTPPAPAQPAATATTATTVTPVRVAKPAKGSPDEIICKHHDETGSRIGGRQECYTRAQWDELSRSAHDDIQRAQQVVQMPH